MNSAPPPVLSFLTVALLPAVFAFSTIDAMRGNAVKGRCQRHWLTGWALAVAVAGLRMGRRAAQWAKDTAAGVVARRLDSTKTMILNLLIIIGAPCLFILLPLYFERQAAVKGSQMRYVLTGWSWLLLWPAYAACAAWLAQDIITYHEPVGWLLTLGGVEK